METLEDKLKREQNAALLDSAIASRKADKVSYELRLEQMKASLRSNELAAYSDFTGNFLEFSRKIEQLSKEIEALSKLKNEVAPHSAPQLISEDTPF